MALTPMEEAMACGTRTRRKARRGSLADLSFSARLPVGLGGIYADSIFAVKCSVDPLADFRRSITEMVAEVGVRDWEEMEELVHCYVVLNSSDMHDLIADAFLSLCSLSFHQHGTELRN